MTFIYCSLFAPAYDDSQHWSGSPSIPLRISSKINRLNTSQELFKNVRRVVEKFVNDVLRTFRGTS